MGAESPEDSGTIHKEGDDHPGGGCGPGFFTLDMADMAGETGRVIACDLQEGMLHKVRDKVQGPTSRDASPCTGATTTA